MIEVSMREWVILTVMRDFKQKHGRVPNWTEIKVGCGIKSQQGLSDGMDKLMDAGVLSWRRGTRGTRGTLVLHDVPVAVHP